MTFLSGLTYSLEGVVACRFQVGEGTDGDHPWGCWSGIFRILLMSSSHNGLIVCDFLIDWDLYGWEYGSKNGNSEEYNVSL